MNQHNEYPTEETGMNIRTAVMSLCIAVFAGCGLGPSTNAPAAGGTPPSISGKLVESDGKSPACGAVVTVRPADAIAPIAGTAVAKTKAVKRMALTGPDGRFAIDSCAAGDYVIEGTGGGMAIRIDSVIITDPKKTTEVPPQSLQAPGALRGRVLLRAGGDPRNVFVLAFGSDRFAQAKSDGAFFMGDLPYGDYDLKIICVLAEYGGCKTTRVTVMPGDTARVDTVTFDMQELCVPKNLTIRYDTMMQRVSLNWDSCPGSRVRGYNVYRYDTSLAYQYGDQPLNAECVRGIRTYEDDSLLINRTYVYGIAVVAEDGSVGKKGAAAAVTTALPYRADTVRMPAGLKLSNVSWSGGARLTGTCGGPSKAVVIDYGSDFSIVRRSDIPLHFASCRCIVAAGENVYLLKDDPDPDSCIYSYNRNGVARFVCNMHTSIRRFAVRNDTFFVTSDGGATFGFDSTGKAIRDSNDISLFIFGGFKLATNGRFYGFWYPDRPRPGPGKYILELSEQIVPTRQVTTLAIDTVCDALFLDASDKFFYYSIRACVMERTVSTMVVADGNGRVLARFPSLDSEGGVINSRGQIAYKGAVQTNTTEPGEGIIVLTPH
jgi:hypothetical protein